MFLVSGVGKGPAVVRREKSDPLGLESEMVVSHRVEAGNQAWVLRVSDKCFKPWCHPFLPHLTLSLT